MKLTIGVMGSSSIQDALVADMAERVGSAIARRGAVLITGATSGFPLAAAKGAKQAGGEVIGFSPALTVSEHDSLGLPFQYHDLIIYTGLTYKGRNLLNVRASLGLIFIGGSMGTLNEFTIAYDEEKILGVLEGSGGFCDQMNQWMKYLAKSGNRAVLHYRHDPEELVAQVFDSVQRQFADLSR